MKSSIKPKHPDQQETMALLELLRLGKKEHMDGKFQSADDFFTEMDAEDLGPENENQRCSP